jgi:phosphoglycerate-specific signal transduction histidine kinase
MQVLREFQSRGGTMAQLLAERDQLRREALRTTAEAARLEKQRDEATRAAARAKVSCVITSISVACKESLSHASSIMEPQ